MLFTKNYLSLFIVIFLPFFFSLINNYQKSVTLTSVLFLSLCIVFYKKIFSDNVFYPGFKVEKYFPIRDSVFLLVLFFCGYHSPFLRMLLGDAAFRANSASSEAPQSTA